MRNISFFTIVLFMSLSAGAVNLSGSLFSHDPSTITADSGVYWDFYTAPGIGMVYSKNLTTWTSSNKHIYTPGASWKTNYPAWTIPYFGTGSSANTDGNLWAPDVIYMNGAYYLYYSCSSFGSSKSAIGLVKSTSLNNQKWEDQGKVVSSASGTDINAIDPGIFRDDNGKIYMVYGSWSGGIGVVDIDSVTGHATSSVTKIYGGNGLDNEGAYLFKEKSFYYLVVNRGTCCNGVNSTYYMVVGRSANIKGPYSGYRTLLPNKDGKYVGPGHFALLRDTCANYVSIHYYDATRNGSATLDILKMKMVDGWPVLYRDFTFDNCYDEIRLDAGSNEKICENKAFNFSTSTTVPNAHFYSSLYWNDGNMDGSFIDSTSLKPIYTPPASFIGDIKLILTGTGNDSITTTKDSMNLTVIVNNVSVDAGSDEETMQDAAFDFSTSTTKPSAVNYNFLLWDDGGSGGSFSNKTLLKPVYYPPSGKSGSFNLTLTATGDADCTVSDSMTLTVSPTSIKSISQEGIFLYPNPTGNGSFTIDLSEISISSDQVSVDIYQFDGRKVYSTEMIPTKLININTTLESGIYQLYVKSDKKLLFQEKLIVK